MPSKAEVPLEGQGSDEACAVLNESQEEKSPEAKVPDSEAPIRTILKLENLPEICFLHILQTLSFPQRLKLRRVSKTWKKCIEEDFKNCHKIHLFDNHSMMRNFQRKNHLYNFNLSCKDHINDEGRSFIAKPINAGNMNARLVELFPRIHHLVIGSPWHYNREIMLCTWELKSLGLYIERQTLDSLEKLLRMVENLLNLKSFTLFNVGSCQFTVGMLYDICMKLDHFGLFDYRHENIHDILDMFRHNTVSSLTLDNCKFSRLPFSSTLKTFTYGWSDNKNSSCQEMIDELLEQIPEKFPALKCLNIATKYNLVSIVCLYFFVYISHTFFI